jgi:N-acetyltransferase
VSADVTSTGPRLGPVTLEGEHIRLSPLTRDHLPNLLDAAQDAEIWTYLPADLRDPAGMERRIGTALNRQAEGLEYAFAVEERASGRVLGSTSYADVSEAHRAVEIGWTWYAPDAWGTRANPEAKYLLLRHAFETWGAIRVSFKTDSRNARSRAAIEKLGAQYEGTLRSHRLLPDGYRRDSVLFSVLDHEWPEVKTRLEQRLRVLDTTPPE